MKIKHSLKVKVVSIILLFALLLAGGTAVISYLSYTRAFNEHYESLATSVSKTTASVLDPTLARALTEDVNEVYNAICAENGGVPDFDNFTPEDEEAYYARFAAITESPAYTELLEMLHKVREDNGVRSLYLAVTNKETMMDLYLVDASDEGDACIPGDCDVVQQQHIDQINAGNYSIKAFITNYDEYGWICTAGEPLLDEVGNVICVAYVDISMDEIVHEREMFLLRIAILVAIATILLLALVILLTDRAVLRPIKKLGVAAENYIHGKKSGDTDSSAFSKVSIHTGDEIEQLSRSLLQMEADIGHYIQTVTAVTAEKERIGAELDVATRIQASMLPCIFPAFPEREEFEVYASMSPAKEVGGDFYDFFMVDEDNLAIVVADVSGKGVPAALFMVIGKTLIKDHTAPGKDLGEVFAEVNEILCESNSEELFITAFEGVLNLKTGEFRFVNAGHEIPFICKKGETFKPHKIRAGFVLAGMEGVRYRAGSLQLEPGDKLFQYTDGVTEATDKDNRLFGMERLEITLGRLSDATPTEILQGVKADIDAFVGDAPQFDDITMLCVAYNGAAGAVDPSITATISLDEIPRLTEYVESTLEAADASMGTVMKMNIALDEIFSNIVKFSGATYAKIICTVEDGVAVLCFEDDGAAYDPLKKEDADTTLSAEEREIGGLGILMVKKSMDDMAYEYRDGKNLLILKKRI